jgi:hypothetical protein
VLPTTNQVQSAINKSKIDIILNREIKYLEFEVTLEWADRVQIIEKLINRVLTLVDIPGLIKKEADEIRRISSEPIRLADFLALRIPPFGGTRGIQKIIIGVLGPFLAEGLEHVSREIKKIEDEIRSRIASILLPQKLTASLIKVVVPIILNLDLDKSGQPYAFASIHEGASENNMIHIDNNTVYELSPSSILSQTNHGGTLNVKTTGKAMLDFKNPGFGEDFNFGVDFFIGIGVSSSDTSGATQRKFSLGFDFVSKYSNKSVQVELQLPTNSYEMQSGGTFSELKKLPVPVITKPKAIFNAFK